MVRWLSMLALLVGCGGGMVSPSSPSPPARPLLPPSPVPSSPAPVAAPSVAAPPAPTYEVAREVIDLGEGEPMWLYRPEPMPAVPRLVLAAPSGGAPMVGAALREADRADHEAWARLGWVVAAHAVSGAITPDTDNVGYLAAIRRYRRARAGVDDARRALDRAMAAIPDLDGVLAFGRGRGGATALLVASQQPQVRWVVAIEPPIDGRELEPLAVKELAKVLDGFPEFLEWSHPASHVDDNGAAVMLIGDQTELDEHAAALTRARRTVRREAPSREVIGQAASWIDGLRGPPRAPGAVARGGDAREAREGLQVGVRR